MSSTKKRDLSPSPSRSKYDKHHPFRKSKKKKSSRGQSESSDSTDTSSSESVDRAPREKIPSKKRRHRSSSSDSSPSPKKRKKEKKKKKKLKKEKKKKKKHKKERREQNYVKKLEIPTSEKNTVKDKVSVAKDSDVKGNGPSPRIMKPMTKEEWEKQQSVVRRVYDPETGRNRLVKGDGEILEEIVSKDRHKEINKQATRGDGAFFQSRLGIQDK